MVASFKDALSMAGVTGEKFQSEGRIITRAMREEEDRRKKAKKHDKLENEYAAQEAFIEFMGMTEDSYDIITWGSFEKFIKPFYKTIAQDFQITRFPGVGIALQRDALQKVIKMAIDRRYRGSVYEGVRKNWNKVYATKVLNKEGTMITDIVMGKKFRRQENGRRKKMVVPVSCDSRLRIVEIEFRGEFTKAADVKAMQEMVGLNQPVRA